MIPMRLDALRVKKPLQVAGALADFSKLPYRSANRDVGSERANISEDIVTAPFADGGVLAPGLHLHWALPDALTQSYDNRGDADDGTVAQIEFPPVPTLWRITRIIDQDESQIKSWLLESDYVYPAGEGGQSGAICYPLDSDKVSPDDPPYRYLGRVTELGDATLAPYQDTIKSIAKTPLTALGYGEPTFAAFYPNCRSVFGFRDPDPPMAGQSADYYVTGWFRDPEDDFCHPDRCHKTFKHRSIDMTDDPDADAEPPKGTLDTTYRARAFSQVFGWQAEGEAEDVPERSAYFARLNLGHDEIDEAPDPAPDVSVALGNNMTEALSAFLASTQTQDRDTCEDQLEALHLMAELDHLRIDTGAKFREARHARGFTSVPAGTLWQVTSKQTAPTTADASKISEEVTLDYELAHALNRLNTAQLESDKLSQHIESHRLVAFADWYKYMLCKYPPEDQADQYPDIDEARYLMETGVLPNITRLEGLKAKADKAITDRATDLTRLMDACGVTEKLTLKQIAAPRYWQPNEPVVLLTGKNVKPMDRHRADKTVTCPITDHDPQDLMDDGAGLVAMIRDHWAPCTPDATDTPGLRMMKANPWNPLLFEWETQVWPMVSKDGALQQKLATYQPDFITSQYCIHHDKMDLTLEDGEAETYRDPQIYHGRSILTPQAKPLLLQQIDDYLDTHLYAFFKATHALWPDEPGATIPPEAIQSAFLRLTADQRMLFRFFDETGVPSLDRKADYLNGHLPQVQGWYKRSGAQSCDAFIQSILDFKNVVGAEFHVLTQSLTGFNAALLAQKQTLQLPVSDPLAFPDQDGLSTYQDFANTAATAVQNRFNRYAPAPMLAFSPIRSGRMALSQLRLIDTFGRHANVDVGRLQSAAVSTTLNATDPDTLGPGQALLPPRFVQPVRLNFRWLAGGHGRNHEDQDLRADIQANSHPATSPVCGWLVPNLLDGSLQVFDPDGRALGYLDLKGTWRRPPGQTGVARDALPNVHLQRVVSWLEWSGGTDTGILASFLSAMDTALENVDPVNWAQHESIALLMARPVAVVRAELRLEMRGRPALDPDWDLYDHALKNGRDPKLESRLVEAVDVPIRIGEHDQLNDGLIGFWKETVIDKDGHYDLPDTFMSPQADALCPISTTDGKTVRVAPHLTHGIGEDQALNFTLRLHQPPQKLTMLVDPRARVHASCGIVPTKAINIPPDQYRKALKAIEVSFMASPVLAVIRVPQDGIAAINIPLPKVPDYQWRWTENSAQDWRDTTAIYPISTEANMTQLSRLRDGYLILSKQPDTIAAPADPAQADAPQMIPKGR